ncbi:MAG: hypothetical protein KJ592_02880 [Nanoarchaeota archaeon]|nr:hypothetical protein [Nanoarchaeota archaeon]
MADLVVYDMKGLKQVKKVLFGRAMFGYLDSSSGGKYKYDRKGLIDEVSCFRFSENVIACKGSRDTKAVVDLLREFKIGYEKYRASISNSKFV